MAADPPEQPAADPEMKPRRRRRWPRVLLGVLLVLVAFGIWLAGPGLEKIGGLVLRQQLEKAGLEGEFDLSEIGRSGARLQDVELDGPGLVRSIRADSLEVEYRLGEIRTGQIRSAAAENVEIVLDLDAAPDVEKDPEVPFDAEALGATLRSVRDRLGPMALDARNVTIRIVRGEEPVLSIDRTDVWHEADHDHFQLRFNVPPPAAPPEPPPVASDPAPREKLPPPENEPSPPAPEAPSGIDVAGEAGVTVPQQSVELIWTDEGLTVDRLELLPGLAVEGLTVNHVEGQPLRAEGVARIDAAAVSVRLEDHFSDSRIVLEEGTLDLAAILRRFSPHPRVAGTVTALDLTIIDLFLTPGQWEIEGAVEAPSVRYDGWAVEDVALEISKTGPDARARLAAEFLGTSATLAAEVQLQPAHAADPSRWWHDVRVSGSFETANLHPALVGLRRQLDPDPPATPIPSGALATDFEARWDGPVLAEVAADYRLHQLEMEGTRLPALDGRVLWNPQTGVAEGTARQIRADGVDGLRVRGSWNSVSESYEASVALVGYELDPVADLLRPFAISFPSGTATGTWQGAGNLSAGTHRGELTLENATLDFPQATPFSLATRASYDWPGQVEVAALELEQGNRSLTLNGAWRDGWIVVENLALRDGETSVLQAQARVPWSETVTTAEEFLAQPGPFSASFEVADLSLAQLRGFVPGIELPASGAIAGQGTIGGTLANPEIAVSLAVADFSANAMTAAPPMDLALDLRTAPGRLQAHLRGARDDQLRLELEADLPFSTQLRSVADFFAQPGEIAVNVQSSELSIEQIETFLPAGSDIPATGTAEIEAEIGGTFDRPSIDARLELRDLASTAFSQIDPADLSLELRSQEDRVRIDGRAEQSGALAATLEGSMPFRPGVWAEKPDTLREERVDLRVRLEDLDLNRFAELLPGAEEFAALANADVHVEGPLGSPEVRGSVHLDGGRLRLKNRAVPPISELSLDLRFEGRQATLSRLNMNLAGGPIAVRGTADLTDLANPILNVSATATQALVWRDDSMNLRTNASLQLTGPLDSARLSGNLAVVESFYYRDIEIIPIGRPMRGLERPEVAQVDVLNPVDQPEALVGGPLGNWTLDVSVRTQDPILIRGNLAEGRITGNIRALGTLGVPRLDGHAELADAQARLPLSTLNVRRGTATFTPSRGIEPHLEIRGTSRLSPYDVSIYLYGPLSDTSIVLTSDPPLPENEIMTLLATGSTTQDLEDTDAATMKAVQLFIEELRRGRLPFGRRLADVLEIFDDVEIRVGENDPFTGRRLSSATIEINDRVLLSGAVDQEGNSRGVIMYLFRFR